MRRLFFTFLILLCVTVNGYLVYLWATPEFDVRGEYKDTVIIHAERQDVREKLAQDKVTQGTCYIWGPFREKTLQQAHHQLKTKGLDAKTVINENLVGERYVVLLGPLRSETGARAFVKQFRQQGFKEAQFINRGPMTPSAAIAFFETEKAAQKFLESDKAPRIKGFRILKEEGIRVETFGITVHSLTPEEEKKLRAIQAGYPKTTLKACQLTSD